MFIELIKIDYKKINHIRILYILLSKRNYNISHNKLPTYQEHKDFVINSPYRVWYLIKKNNQFIGTIYISNENVIGINVNDLKVEDYEIILKNLLSKYDPLKPIKSVRNASFLINVNPNNLKLIECMKKIGMEHIQSTFLLKSIIK